MCVIHVQVKRRKSSKIIFNFQQFLALTPGTHVCVQFSWPVSEGDVKRLNTWERMYGPVVEQGSRKMKTNQELCELYRFRYSNRH